MPYDLDKVKYNKTARCAPKTCPSCNKQQGVRNIRSKEPDCSSCVRKKQWKSGVFSAVYVDESATNRWCSHCKKHHPWVAWKSNEFWLLRSKKRHKYECRVARKERYNNSRLDDRKKLRKAVSNLIRDCVAKHNAYKKSSFPKYVDWSIEDLKKHLEAQFQPGMTWDNYGKWHIDHVVPDSWFEYKSCEDDGFKKSWSLDNLQPLWAGENLKKGNRYCTQPLSVEGNSSKGENNE